MKLYRRSKRAIAIAVTGIVLAWSGAADAHCDTLDGPVVGAARKALDSGTVNPALAWVQKKDEGEVRAAFDKARAVRKAGGAAKELADTYFFETLVRVHRAGENAPYTGLKPAGRIEAPIAAADNALQSGKLEPVAELITKRVHEGLHKQFSAVNARKKYDINDVAAGRAYVAAYVEYVHYVERMYDAAQTGGHAGEAAPAPHAHGH